MNVDKNNLVKIYSVNYYPTNIEFSEIKNFYTFDYESCTFRGVTELKKLIPDIHAFYMKYNYKKYLKG